MGAGERQGFGGRYEEENATIKQQVKGDKSVIK